MKKNKQKMRKKSSSMMKKSSCAILAIMLFVTAAIAVFAFIAAEVGSGADYDHDHEQNTDNGIGKIIEIEVGNKNPLNGAENLTDANTNDNEKTCSSCGKTYRVFYLTSVGSLLEKRKDWFGEIPYVCKACSSDCQ